jgi:glycine cleavage system aminomethyltransferase T
VSVHAFDERRAPQLESVLSRAGAVRGRRDGAPVVLNYGSAAGELAACMSAAGVADCSWLAKLELSGPPEVVANVVRAVTASSVATGGALHAVSAWWCGLGDGQVIVLCEKAICDRLRSFLDVLLARDPRLQVVDRGSRWSAIAVVGRRAGDVLTALGVYGPAHDPRTVAPFAAGSAGEVPALWLLESDLHALALVEREQAGAAWLAIERAGRASGICCVGQDAIARYELLERRPTVALV